MIKSGVSIERDTVDEVMLAIRNLTKKDVLIGVPEEKGKRTGEDTVSNAAIGYWNEFGVPANNLPPRPHLIPGVRDATDDITREMALGAEAAMSGDHGEAEKALTRVGLIAVAAVKKRIQSGLSPPLKRGAIRARWNRQKRRRGKPIPPDFVSAATPLINTGAYIRSITFVIEDRDG